MSEDIVLSVSGLGKKFAPQLRQSLAYGLHDIISELVPRAASRRDLRPGEFWALNDVSFELRRGESLAIVGHNGAGKSTLLKVLYGLLKPDRGSISIEGRTEAIIELGTGFNGLLSGRENVEVGAALHGMGRRDTSRLLDAVIDFAGIAQFIDAPVQAYSSGMKARLAFALSAHLEPNLLLVDEVLAVGDLTFQRKCVAQMRQYLASGGALLLVSHNTYQVQAVCKRGLMLEQGHVVFQGSAVETLNHMFEQHTPTPQLSASPSGSDGPLVIEAVSAAGLECDSLTTGGCMRITISYFCQKTVVACAGFGVWSADQWVCITGNYEEEGRTLEAGSGEIHCLIPKLSLLPGSYVLRAVMLDPVTGLPLALFGWNDPGLPLKVRGPATAMANSQNHLNQMVSIDATWK